MGFPNRDAKDITEVLLADGWHEVQDASFRIEEKVFSFSEMVDEGKSMIDTHAPVSSILAVRSKLKGINPFQAVVRA